MFRRCAFIVTIGLCSACAVEGVERDLGGVGFGDGGEEDGDTSGEGSDGGGDGVLLDVGSGHADGGPDGGVPGCQKVDLLFVVDSSGSMADNQAELVSSFPDFISAIEDELDVNGHHVGVVSTDAYPFNAPGCRAMGDLVTKTGGEASSQAECGPFVEGRFLTDQDDLGPGFACAATVGIEGSGDERPAEAIITVLGDDRACNEGFLRDDALLVVVIISDEDDGLANPPPPSPFNPEPGGTEGDPADWFETISAAKGNEDRLVVLSLVAGPDGSQCGKAEAQTADRIVELTEMFTHGFVGDVCAPSYAPFFSEAISVIESACSEFEPEG